MNTIQFKGHHSRIPHADVTLLPDREHSLWQAWYMPSGRYMIQALDDSKRPEGTVHLLDAETFSQTLTPMLASISETSQAIAPNLISQWYNEMASLKGQDLYGPPIVDYNSPLPPLHPETLAAIELAKTLAEEERAHKDTQHSFDKPIEEQPHILPRPPASSTPNPAPPQRVTPEQRAPGHIQSGHTQSGHTKSGQAESQQTTPKQTKDVQTTLAQTAQEQSAHVAQEQAGKAQVTQDQNGQEQAGQTQSTDTSVHPDFHSASYAGGSSSRHFEDILQLIHEGNEQALEERVNRLISIPIQESDTSYQAVLTELGLTLRQKQRYSLARLCHLKALAMAPDDERILFNLARTEYEAGDIKAAKAHLKRCLTLAPDFDVAKNFLTFIDAGA